ncbi:MAG: 4-(cytidine 5'-diphospho)-2-C-methyl-D-erythritol kinase, partial [Planctomycetes bacterium]|nr:4-(cytidine 5'-diphospho)-2-C-methyl-D-erythritol kinase [Planctomycetota bacterium]
MTDPTTVPLAAARAHAKVNLHLGVGAARPDGYHELSTVFQSVSVADTVTLHAADAPAPDAASIVTGMRLTSGANPDVPLSPDNLAWQAVDALVLDYRREHGPRDLPGVSIDLHKSIPVAGGMAGGSADAAAALVAADAWLAREYAVAAFGVDKLLALGAGLGADVPFTLRGGSALGTDRGDRLTTMMSRGPFHWAMITNARGLSTGSVFAKLDEMRAAD